MYERAFLIPFLSFFAFHVLESSVFFFFVLKQRPFLPIILSILHSSFFFRLFFDTPMQYTFTRPSLDLYACGLEGSLEEGSDKSSAFGTYSAILLTL